VLPSPDTVQASLQLNQAQCAALNGFDVDRWNHHQILPQLHFTVENKEYFSGQVLELNQCVAPMCITLIVILQALVWSIALISAQFGSARDMIDHQKVIVGSIGKITFELCRH
jgi:hypothetical protein